MLHKISLTGDNPSWSDELKFQVHVPQLTIVQFAILRQVVFREAPQETSGGLGHGLVRNAIRNRVTKLANVVSASAVEAEHDGPTKQLITKQSFVCQYTLPFASIVQGNIAAGNNRFPTRQFSDGLHRCIFVSACIR